MADDSRGEYTSDTIYDDLNITQIKSIPETAVHRSVDLLVVEADEQGYVCGIVVLPVTVYGIATHALVAAGISNPHSVQIPMYIRAAFDRERPGVVGKGKGLVGDVHIADGASHSPTRPYQV